MSKNSQEPSDSHDTAKAETVVRDDPLGRFLGYCVAVVAILGIPTGLYGYFSGEHAKRVQNTFEFYKDFRSAGVQEKYEALISGYDQKASEIRDLMLKFRDNVPERDRQVLQVINGIVMNGDGMKKMSAVLLFFDELTACVNSSLCNRNAAVALFGLPAREFASAYAPYILDIRKEYKNDKYGTGLFQMRALETEWSIFDLG